MLRITDISFRDFRSYERFDLHEIGPLTIFVGPNAIGKTNIIEGIQLLTALSSFRNATIEQMVRRGASASTLSSHMTDGNRELDLSLHMEPAAKRYQLNEKAKRPIDLKGLIPAVTFTPDDLELVKGSMSARRHALDTLGSQLSPNYHLVKKDYEKVIKHKNRLLKDEASPLMIEAVDELLITCGTQLTCYRVALFERIAKHITQRYGAISGGREELTAVYEPSWFNPKASGVEAAGAPGAGDASVSSSGSWADLTKDQVREQLTQALFARRSEEFARRRALVGPHADSITFYIDGLDASQYGSQGQQRTIVLAYKLSEAAVTEDMLGKKPILLLDDVMSELDGARREALVEYISQDVQTFITTANIAYFDERMLERAQVVTLPMEESRGGEA